MIMVDSLGIGIELYKKEKKMGRIYVTGDIHSEPDRFNTENFPEQKEMTRDDYVIICGDFGLVRERPGGSTGWKTKHTPPFSWTGIMKTLPDSTHFQ